MIQKEHKTLRLIHLCIKKWFTSLEAIFGLIIMLKIINIDARGLKQRGHQSKFILQASSNSTDLSPKAEPQEQRDSNKTPVFVVL
jgi:hypothetical protein